MGGPGIVMSRATLALIYPHIRQCLANLYTTHEDVEIGRCVKKYAGVSCLWNYEVSPAARVSCTLQTRSTLRNTSHTTEHLAHYGTPRTLQTRSILRNTSHTTEHLAHYGTP